MTRSTPISDSARAAWLARGGVLLALALLPGCAPGSPEPARPVRLPAPPFAVAAFPADGERDVYRDEALVIDFTAPVDPRSVRPGSIRLLRRRGNEEIPVALTVEGTRVTIHPPVPFGLDGNSGFRLIVEGFPSLAAPADLSGRLLARRYRGRFWTSRFYRPGLAPPVLTSVEAREEPGGRYSLRLRFSKPMEASSVTAPGNLEVLAGDAVVPGDLSHDHRSEEFRFLPRDGTRPRELRVVVSRGIQDLLGNPLALPDPPEYRVTLPDLERTGPADEISEDFTTTDHLDPARTTALWNSPRAPGVLLGEPASLDFLPEIEPDPLEASVAIGAERTTARVLLWPEEIGPAREITGLLLEPLGAAAPAEYTELTVRVTRTLRRRLEERGLDLDPPVTVFEAHPWQPPAGERGACVIPFIPTITHDGSAGLLLEITIGPGSHTNHLRAEVCEPHRAEVRQGEGSASVRPVLGLRGFSMEPVATSRFYDSGEERPVWLEPISEPGSMPAGVTLTLSFQGATRLGPDGRPPDDPGAISEWTDDVTRLPGFRYLRFRAAFRGVSLGREDVLIDSLRIPFRR